MAVAALTRECEVVSSSGLNLQVRRFKTVPSGKFGGHRVSVTEVSLDHGIICPWQAREEILQPAGHTELVLGDKDMSADAQENMPFANLLLS